MHAPCSSFIKYICGILVVGVFFSQCMGPNVTVLSAADGGKSDRATASSGDFQVPNNQGMVCDDEQWCWENPFPQGGHIIGIWAESYSDAWVIAHPRTLLRFQNNAWSRVAVPIGGDMSAIWGKSNNDIWLAARNEKRQTEIWHYNGTQWSLSKPSNGSTTHRISAIWGTQSNAVWAVGQAGLIYQWDGKTWKTVSSNTYADLAAIWGSAPNDVWAVGMHAQASPEIGGTILHWDGNQWASIAFLPIIDPLTSVWGTAADDVWAVIGHKGFLHWDGKQWSPQHIDVMKKPWLIGGDADTKQLWVVGDDDDDWLTPAAIVYNRPGKWEKQPLPYDDAPPTLTALWASKNGVWIGGTYGRVYRGNAESFDRLIHGAKDSAMTVLWGHDDRPQWAIDQAGKIHRYSATEAKEGRWLEVEETTSFGAFRTIWGRSANDVWAAGDDSLFAHYDGKTWTKAASDTASGPQCDVTALWSFEPNTISAGCTSGAMMMNSAGQNWSVTALAHSAGFRKFWGTDANNRWLIAEGTAPTLHWDGTKWRQIDGMSAFVTLWGTSNKDVWALHKAGAIHHWDGKQWREISSQLIDGASNSFPYINAAWVNKTDDIWATTIGNTVEHWDGKTWKTVGKPSPSDIASSLFGIYAHEKTIWVSGAGHSIIRKKF